MKKVATIYKKKRGAKRKPKLLKTKMVTFRFEVWAAMKLKKLSKKSKRSQSKIILNSLIRDLKWERPNI